MLRMTSAIKDATKGTLFDCVKAIKGLYASRGFKAYGDNEFNCIKDKLTEDLKITFHPVAKGAHEPHIERDDRVGKEHI